ncbi:TetR/AcrR family transcriptional regulator [Nocardia alba]|uniref:TetR family transcriptional regulator n=1 Tax=Nocardia alba TaxID=225051 RepID=A0A4R1FUS9_9NOCA|nr:TetR/AcrR family transcriptional regulator [Nocardia alba]TCJ97449.1 TetR family transcriptional regulator [Nocardia alba]
MNTVAGPRERLIRSAILLMREHGVAATGLADLLAHSKTARGSIYLHFPGGKNELMEQATLRAGQQISATIDALIAESSSPAQVVAGLVEVWKRILDTSSFTAGCPIVAAAQSGADSPSVQAAAATVFADWTRRLADFLVSTGMDSTAASSIGSVIVSTIEGAIIRCRSEKSLRPLDDAGTNLIRLLEPPRPSPSE